MTQHTIKQSVTISGVGLHTGKPATLTFIPAPINHGFKFRRVDIEASPLILADVNKVHSTNRGTTLQFEQAQVSTVEHALSALTGLEIDNVLIEIDGPEIPILDGSADLFIRALLSVGKQPQDARRDYYEVTQTISYRDEATGAELIAIPDDHFSVTVMIDFNSPVLGRQYASLDSIADFPTEIAPCRTFVFLHELEYLLDQNLIKGGDIDNAVVIVDRVMNPAELQILANKIGKPSILVEKEGTLNNTQLRFNNEPARHKLLDVIGDLALIGKPFKGKIIATKPGHTANVAFARILKKHFLENIRLRDIPKYNPDKEPVLNTLQITKRLPHRFPFLLIDKIIELSKTNVVGIKNITVNEAFFEGHFPGNPIMPGVLQLEAMAQAGGILALANTPEGETWDTYLLKIDNCKFREKALPGDTLILKLTLKEPIRRGIVQMQGVAYVGTKVISEAEMTALVQKRRL